MFRLVLTLMLCLSVPLAGWASVLDGPSCPRQPAPHDMGRASAVAHPHLAADGDHCNDPSDHGAPCHGDHCGCGCGFGWCAGSAVSIAALPASTLLYVAGSQSLPQADAAGRLESRDGSLFRPPIA